jgi:hypothetical protein
MPNPTNLQRWATPFLVLLSLLALTCPAALTPSNVLVVYNAPASDPISDGKQITDHYLIKRPGALAINLADETLAPGTISYANFKSKIRDSLRNYLTSNSLEQQIRVVVLTKDIPHRIQDINSGNVGDTPGVAQTLLNDGNATYASVDSELTLLYQDLDQGENNESSDSSADGLICNPFYQPTVNFPSQSSSLINIPSTSSFQENGPFHWIFEDLLGSQRDPSFICLTSRLDGNSVSSIKSSIDRASSIILDSKRFTVLLDASTRTLDTDFYEEIDYDRTNSQLGLNSWTARIHDRSPAFYLGANSAVFTGDTPSEVQTIINSPIALLASFGANHDSFDQTNWLGSFQGQLPNGAIYNTYESYNGKSLGNVPGYSDHSQVAQWIDIGGTFAVGHAWEPFAETVARNLYITHQLYQKNFTWVEAAWSGIPFLSWQNIVLGDPLAVATVNSNNPQLTLSSSEIPSASLEADTPVYTVSISSDELLENSLDIDIRIVGATILDDYQTNIPGFDLGTSTTVTMPTGQSQVDFNIQLLDDSNAEGLEVLEISLQESADLNGDGYGDSYGLASTKSILIPIPDDHYSCWRYAMFEADFQINVASVDSDSDGLDNLWEYLLSTDPKVPNNPGGSGINSPLISLNANIDATALTFELPNNLPLGAKIILESANSLTTTDSTPVDWTPVANRVGDDSWEVAAGVSVITDDSHPDTDIITITVPDGDRSFCRFKAEAIATP